jgi:hypothetical protein
MEQAPLKQGVSGEQESPRTKRCPVCAEDIRADALLCIQCKSPLDWRRYLQFSNTTLTLLIDLISVATAAAPVFNRILFPSDSRYQKFTPLKQLTTAYWLTSLITAIVMGTF